MHTHTHTYRVVSKQVNHAILAEKEVGVLNRIIYIYIYIKIKSISCKCALGRKILSGVFSFPLFSRDSH